MMAGTSNVRLRSPSNVASGTGTYLTLNVETIKFSFNSSLTNHALIFQEEEIVSSIKAPTQTVIIKGWIKAASQELAIVEKEQLEIAGTKWGSSSDDSVFPEDAGLATHNRFAELHPYYDKTSTSNLKTTGADGGPTDKARIYTGVIIGLDIDQVSGQENTYFTYVLKFLHVKQRT